MTDDRVIKVYLRFGHIPKDLKSKAHRGDAILKEEKGISVWNCAFVNDVPFPLLPDNPSESCMADYFYLLFGNKSVYLVTGTELSEKGSAGEPLLDTDITVIKDYSEDYEYLKKIHRKDANAESRQVTGKLPQPCEDLISRQVVLDFIDEVEHKGFIGFTQLRRYVESTGRK